jgi:hypothetical protein
METLIKDGPIWQGHTTAPPKVHDISQILTPSLKKEPTRKLMPNEADNALAKLPELLHDMSHMFRDGDVLYIGSGHRPDEFGFAFVDRSKKEWYTAPDYGVSALDPEKEDWARKTFPTRYETMTQLNALVDAMCEFSNELFGDSRSYSCLLPYFS